MPNHTERFRVLAIMQNQWFRDPARVKHLLATSKNPKAYRRRLISYALFAGCRSGQVLQRALGKEWCEEIVWEEASKEIGSEARSVFPADIAHVRECIDEVNPHAIVTFGKVAEGAIASIREYLLSRYHNLKILHSPHPTSRNVGAEDLIRQIRFELNGLRAKWAEETFK